MRLRLADVYLDSFPFSGATSLLDPLDAGLPVVTMDGTTFRALVGPALLRSIGLEELIAPDPQSYVGLACSLGRDGAGRTHLCERIRKAMQSQPKFYDARWYAGQVAGILSAIWKERSAANFAPVNRTSAN
jgi:predicted O-linked N-acetylglucosamine transferase (SPINDLY family)